MLPPSLSQLTQLEVLTLSSNHIYQFPDEIVGLEKLKVGLMLGTNFSRRSYS